MKVDNATKKLAMLAMAEKWIASLAEGVKDNLYYEHKPLIRQTTNTTC